MIQRKDADETDFSTCFWAGFGLSVVLYAILFFCAPLLARFYEKPILTSIIRVMGIRLIVASMNSVQHAYVSKHMQFRKFFYSTLIGTVISSVVGIYLAYRGAGVWALVAQYMTNSVCDTFVLLITIKWKPRLLFSWQRFKKFFAYAWKLFVSGFLNHFYSEVRTLIIAKKYSDSDLAFYNKGYSFPSLIIGFINTSINGLIFPVLAFSNEKKEEMKRIVKRGFKTASYIIFPLLLGFAAVAETFVEVVLTDKWMECAVFIQIFCISDLLSPMNSIASNVMRAVGRSDLVLKNNIIIKVIGFGFILMSVRFGVFWIAISTVAATFVASVVNNLPLKSMIGYSIKEEFIDVLPYLLLSVVMSVLVWCVGFLNIPKVLLLLFQVLVGMGVYVGISELFKLEQYQYLKKSIAEKLRKR